MVATAAHRIAMVAGETSGDLLAGLLLQGLRHQWPDLQAQGIGGPRMAEQGFEAWWPHHKLAVHGFSWELLMRYREIVGIRDQLAQRLLATEAEKPVLFVGVDAPDFNLQLEERLRQQGVRTAHFVCPSIWAWRPERVERIRRSADHVLCLFPFEPALLAQHGIAASYVGHPLAQVIPQQADQLAARQALGLPPEGRVLALLPGSRVSEVRHLAERFFRAASLVQKARPAIKIVVPVVPGLRSLVEQAAQNAGVQAHVHIVNGQSHQVLAACDVTLIASGTATLEAALYKKPMVIAYHMAWLSWQLMRRKRLQPWVGLPNILAERFVVPELLQDQASPEQLARAVLQWLECLQNPASAEVQDVQTTFAQLHQDLLRDTPALAGAAIAQLLEPERG
ncbi:lipid-A-disaccharide synthase [Curvibacter sp. CHRR-16]|uniref:lipid-A-disaccharide synthase n=1 Tax=Curvibacter sp. CHRR-16 TaxID=2835872 RepID=UPI001BDB5678|nr:lipid-A-disaccharide synthase [Curvibacter sp. CHRR-16]MBT0570853.1 lipid-A-disaccharide synthase [Curvibacter sp. CHRR-16]